MTGVTHRTEIDSDAPDQISRGGSGARQSRRWLASEVTLGKLQARHTEACIKRLWLNDVGPTATPPDTDRALAQLCLLEDLRRSTGPLIGRFLDAVDFEGA